MMRQLTLILLFSTFIGAVNLSHALGYIGGQSISSAQVPSTLRIQVDCDPNQIRECTAVKVSPRIFLTAAHCVSRQYIPYIHFSRGGSNANPTKTRMAIKEILIHPHYGYGGGTDLALIETEETSPWPVADLAENPPAAGEKIWVGGYGALTWQGEYKSGSLHYDERVRGSLGREEFSLRPKSLQNEGFAQIYFGDSGAPAFSAGQNRQRVYGINAYFRRDNPRRSPKEMLTRVDAKSVGGSWVRQILSTR